MAEQSLGTKRIGEDGNFRFWGKLVLLSIYITQPFSRLGSVDLPFIETINTLQNLMAFQLVWQTTFVVCSIGVFVKRYCGASMFLTGCLLLLAVLANGFNYSNNLFFSGCLLITMSMSSFKMNFVRYQLFVVYLGAFLDKLFFDQWRAGYFMESYFANNKYVQIAENVTELESIPLMMAVVTIAIEAILALLTLIPKAIKPFIFLGVSFHLLTAIIMHSFFGLFIPCILISYVSLVLAETGLSERLPKINTLKNILNFRSDDWKTNAEKIISFLPKSIYVWIVLLLVSLISAFPIKILSTLVWFGLMVVSVNDSSKYRHAQR